jgi:GH15 family glucan-1,4-alpha-glucosidase
MCWVACDRLRRIALRLGLADRAAYWSTQADRIRAYVEHGAWSPALRRFKSTIGGDDGDERDVADASLLLLHELGFLSARDPRFASTVVELERALRSNRLVLRYRADEMGEVTTAFTVCAFWYVDALHALGHDEQARELFEHLLSMRNRHGLLSEDLDLTTGEQWGNFPQTYSMVGLINSAIRLSKPWEEAF